MKRKTSKKKEKNINYRDLLIDTIREKKLPILIGISVFIISYIFLSGFLLKNKILTIKKVNPTPQIKKDEKKIKKYIVKEGDYLWIIALQAYGDGYAWVKIAEKNKINNPNDITPGQVLILP